MELRSLGRAGGRPSRSFSGGALPLAGEGGEVRRSALRGADLRRGKLAVPTAAEAPVELGWWRGGPSFSGAGILARRRGREQSGGAREAGLRGGSWSSHRRSISSAAVRRSRSAGERCRRHGVCAAGGAGGRWARAAPAGHERSQARGEGRRSRSAERKGGRRRQLHRRWSEDGPRPHRSCIGGARRLAREGGSSLRSVSGAICGGKVSPPRRLNRRWSGGAGGGELHRRGKRIRGEGGQVGGADLMGKGGSP
jgi:hypothetical protein